MPKDSDTKKLRKAAQEQGWSVEETRDGWMLKAPNGQTQVSIHRTSSDHRWLKNTVAAMRRGGFQWPPPRKKAQKPPAPQPGESEDEGHEQPNDQEDDDG